MLLQAMTQKIDQAISFNPNFRTLVLFSSIFSSTPTLVVPKGRLSSIFKFLSCPPAMEK